MFLAVLGVVALWMVQPSFLVEFWRTWTGMRAKPVEK
jgi:hypothetical protein